MLRAGVGGEHGEKLATSELSEIMFLPKAVVLVVH